MRLFWIWIELNQILKDWDLPFYRYGPNQLPKFENNIAVKLSYVLNLDSSDWKQILTQQ
jgi:hypothetical protein